jgi:hypothetical protein
MAAARSPRLTAKRVALSTKRGALTTLAQKDGQTPAGTVAATPEDGRLRIDLLDRANPGACHLGRARAKMGLGPSESA